MNRNERRARHAHPNNPAEDSLTQPEFAKDADVNTIVSRSLRTGLPPSTGFAPKPRQPMYGDFTSVSYLDMMNKVNDMNTLFMSLPARLRGRFNNNVYNLIRFAENPANREMSIKMGLIPEEYVHKDVLDLREELEAEAEARERAVPKADPEAQPSHGKKADKPQAP